MTKREVDLRAGLQLLRSMLAYLGESEEDIYTRRFLNNYANILWTDLVNMKNRNR